MEIAYGNWLDSGLALYRSHVANTGKKSIFAFQCTPKTFNRDVSIDSHSIYVPVPQFYETGHTFFQPILYRHGTIFDGKPLILPRIAYKPIH